MAGDFGRYTMGGVDTSFSSELRSSSEAETPELRKRRFWDAVDVQGDHLAELSAEARRAKVALDEAESMWRWRTLLREHTGERITVPSSLRKCRATFRNAEAKLRFALPAELLQRYELESSYPAHNDDRIPKFDLSRAQRWVADRAVALGWLKEKHGEIERRLSWSNRDRHRVERIGKKYQWIAFQELVGYLMDHHWYVSWDDAPATVLDRLEKFRRLDIDPSFLAREGHQPADDNRVPHIALRATDFRGSDAAMDVAWTATTENLPHIPEIVEMATLGGGRWWLVGASRRDGGYLEKLQSDGPMRTAQSWIETIVVRSGDVWSLFRNAEGTDSIARGLFQRNDAVERLFGEHAADLLPSPTCIWSLDRDIVGVQFSHTTTYLNAKRDDDESGAIAGFAVPSDVLMRALALRPEGPWSNGFVTSDGQLAFLDTRITRGQDGAVLVNADLLAPALERAGLILVWVLLAEKDGGLGRGKSVTWREPTARRSFGGLWWQELGAWQGGVWIVPDEPVS